jgi:hypothetical protein
MSKRQRCNPRCPSQLPIELRNRIGEFCGLSPAIIEERFWDVIDQLNVIQKCFLYAYGDMDYCADEFKDKHLVYRRFPPVSKRLELLSMANVCKCGYVLDFQEKVCYECGYDEEYVMAVHRCKVCKQDEAQLCNCATARYCSNACKHKDWRHHRRVHRM